MSLLCLSMKKIVPLSLYWKCQLLGWSISALYWQLNPLLFAEFFNVGLGILHFIADVAIDILITHAYRNYALSKAWNTLHPRQLVWKIIPAIFVLATLFMLTIMLRFYFIDHYWPESSPLTFSEFFLKKWQGPFITGVRLMSIWVLAYHLYHYAQREIKATRENARLAEIAKETQLANLSAQLNPHFFFNCLNTIKALIIEDPTAARRAIDLLSDLLRTSLYGKTEKLINIAEELECVKDYLELEKLRFEERLKSQIDIPTSLMQCQIPPLSIQLMVENAVKHGIDKTKAGGLISISAEAANKQLKIVVKNPGILSATKKNPGLGIKNLQERLHLQFDTTARFDLVQHEQEVLATLSIPLV